MKTRTLAAAVLATAQLAALSAPALAADGKDLVGTWKLVSYQRVDNATGKKLDLFGDKPAGYAMYSAGGRYVAVLTGSNRKPAANIALTDAERAEFFKTMISAYAAGYKVEGNKITYDVDVAWNPGWVGTKQVREIKVDANTLVITNHGTSSLDGKKFTSNLTYTRVK
jgi:hypothetical protein